MTAFSHHRSRGSHAARLRVAGALAAWVACSGAWADFAVGLSPPRFEVQVESGQVSRQVLTIINGSEQPADLSVKTADWAYDGRGGVDFQEPLQPGSCRPWVAIERHQIHVAGGGQYKFRFEITPPPGTAAGECRFALMIEGAEGHVQAGSVDLPLGARMAAVVYAEIGSAKPALHILGTHMGTVEGRATPMVDIRNDGSAHGRLSGFLTGEDAAHTRYDLEPDPAPILPGETRAIALIATRPGAPTQPVGVHAPAKVSGTLEAGDQKLPLDEWVAP